MPAVQLLIVLSSTLEFVTLFEVGLITVTTTIVDVAFPAAWILRNPSVLVFNVAAGAVIFHSYFSP